MINYTQILDAALTGLGYSPASLINQIQQGRNAEIEIPGFGTVNLANEPWRTALNELIDAGRQVTGRNDSQPFNPDAMQRPEGAPPTGGGADRMPRSQRAIAAAAVAAALAISYFLRRVL